MTLKSCYATIRKNELEKQTNAMGPVVPTPISNVRRGRDAQLDPINRGGQRYIDTVKAFFDEIRSKQK